MKICWDNLEKLRYSKRSGKWYNKSVTYIYMKSCRECKEPYLSNKNNIGKFCSLLCSKKGKNHPRCNIKNSDEHKRKISKSMKGKYISKNNPNWKGGVIKKNIPLYNTYAKQIDWCEKVRRSLDNENILEVKCAYCGKWYIPKMTEICSRIKSLNSKGKGECRLYCSNECKQECPIYDKSKYPKGFKESSSREVQTELRQLVFERDKWVCQKCESEKNLHCHHITGVELNPIESADIDNCITYCKRCHKEVHEKEGCTYQDYKRDKCNE